MRERDALRLGLGDVLGQERIGLRRCFTPHVVTAGHPALLVKVVVNLAIELPARGADDRILYEVRGAARRVDILVGRRKKVDERQSQRVETAGRE